MLLSWYLRRLNFLSPNKDRVLDTAEVRTADTRPPMTYHITFHMFDDECRDSGGKRRLRRATGRTPCMVDEVRQG